MVRCSCVTGMGKILTNYAKLFICENFKTDCSTLNPIQVGGGWEEDMPQNRSFYIKEKEKRLESSSAKLTLS